MIPDNEDDLDEVIEEVIKEVCCEEDKTKIKKKTYVNNNSFNNINYRMLQMLHEQYPREGILR